MYDLDPRQAAAIRLAYATMLVRLTALDAAGGVREVFELSRQVITSGSARAELRRDVRRSASLSLANATGSLSPAAVGDLFAQGSRASVEVGPLVDGSPMMVPLMSGFVTTSSASMSGTLSVSLGSHLSAADQEAGAALLLPARMPLPLALLELWSVTLPGITWVIDEASWSRTLGSDIPVLSSDNRLGVGLQVARDLGCEAYDDRLGRIVVRVRTEPMLAPTARVMTEPIDLTRDAIRPPINAQPVEATPGESEPIYVLEEITDPASPLHRSRIGLRVAPTIRSDSIPDPATARATARAWLWGRSLAADQLSVTQLPWHVDLDEGDVVERTEPITGTSGRFIIESIDYPLGPGSQSTTESAVLPLFLESAT